MKINYSKNLIVKTVAVIILFSGIAMILPGLFAVYFGEQRMAITFFATGIASIVFGECVRKFLPTAGVKLKPREGFIAVFSSWFFVILIGTIPYLAAEGNYSFVDSWFESCAGWTTTGSHVLNYEAMPKSLMLWKSLSSWMGGMGIIVLTISIFPVLGIGGQMMASAEVTGPELEKMTARFSDTGKITYRIYFILTAAQFLLLLPTKMGVYYALLNALSSVSTVGILDITYEQDEFGVTPYVLTVCTIFSILATVNFMAYFLMYARRFKLAFGHYEIRMYLRTILIFTILIGAVLYFTGTYDTLYSAFGHGFAQTASFSSTTGFIIGNIGLWPTFCKIALILLSLVGGCSFSASGGFKIIRMVVFLKLITRGFYKRIHPRAIRPIMLQGKPLSARTASFITVFLMLYFALFLFSCLVMSLENYDMETTLSAVAAAFSTTGTSFGQITGSDFSIFSAFGKLYSTILMLAGRLEMYAVLVFFTRTFWNSDKAV